MAYSTPADVRLVLQGYQDSGMPDDPDITPADLSDPQIEYEINNADEQINAVLRRRYNLPLPAPLPPILRNLSIDIAAALSDMQFRGSREYANELNPLRIRYERALLILDRIATGDYPLYNDGEGPEPIGDEAAVFNPYSGDFIRVEDVFPRGLPDLGRGAEYSEVEYIPYYPYLRVRN